MERNVCSPIAKKIAIANVTEWIENELIRVAQVRERLELPIEDKRLTCF
jgi:hypothetical protein